MTTSIFSWNTQSVYTEHGCENETSVLLLGVLYLFSSTMASPFETALQLFQLDETVPRCRKQMEGTKHQI